MLGRLPSGIVAQARHRRIFLGFIAMERALWGADELSPRIHVLADLAAARIIGCRYCLDIGSFVARQHGAEREDLLALDRAQTSARFDEPEKAAIAYAEAMSSTPPTVSEALFDRLRASFSDLQILELTSIVAWEQYRARFNHAVGLAPDGFSAGAYCVLPQPSAGGGEHAA